MLKQIILLAFFYGFVLCMDDRLFPFKSKNKEGRRNSPQMTLEGRKFHDNNSPFVEDLPPGEFRINDALLLKGQEDSLFKKLPTKKIGRAIINDDKLRWTDAVIPYYLDCSIEKLDNAVYAIKAAMAEWERKTCIRFKERTNEKNYLRFIRDTHCWGHVGMNSYSTISCGFGCEQQNVMAHEIGHAVGFYHEQNRKDRDTYVQVMWNNIGQFKSAFEIVKNTYSLGVSYDYSSIMHYPWTAFSSNGKRTMNPRPRTRVIRLAPYVEISPGDIEQTKRMYKCQGRLPPNDEIKKKLKEEGLSDNEALFAEGCQDQSQSCKAWKDAGYCTLYAHVIKYCRITCEDPSCTGGSGCTDKNENCPDWSEGGFCTKNTYVKENCCKSCKDAKPDPQPPPPPTTTRTTTTKKPACVDKMKHCTDWSKEGYCDAGSEWLGYMKENCCLTCEQGTCSGDIQTYCKKWADKGYCKHKDYSGYMEDNCCMTCGVGVAPTTVKPKPTTTGKPKPTPVKPVTSKPDPDGKPVREYLGTGVLCEDMRTDCPSLARRGDCTRNPAFMKYYCKKSCRSTNCDKPGLKPSGSCANPLGLSYYYSRHRLPNDAFKSARGHLQPAGGWNAYPYNARLYQPDDYKKKQIGGWCANTGKSTLQTLQSITIDLQRTKRVTHIATQGRDKYFERISQFKIEYSNDRRTFTSYKENGKDKVFHGSCDYRTPVLNKFSTPIVARYIKYIPWKWNYPCVRMELYGCSPRSSYHHIKDKRRKHPRKWGPFDYFN